MQKHCQQIMAIRDPIHDWIRFSETEKQLINTPLVQRLHWVGQLTIVSMVYQGGTHSRFEHSMGVMHLAGKYMKRLLKTTTDPEFKNKAPWLVQLARVCGLLHDIGHGPFSHSFDYAVYSKIYPKEFKANSNHFSGHDIHRHYIIHNDAPIQSALKSLGIDPNDVSRVWGRKGLTDCETSSSVFTILRAILQGPLGADRMDFTLRDSYYTGTQHFGSISTTRIMDNAFIHNKHLVYKGKVLNDIVNALHGREHMYASVYLHKSCAAGGFLVEKYLKAMIEPLNLIQRTQDLEKFVFLHDHVLSEARVKGLDSSYADKVVCREFPKLICEKRIRPGDSVPVPGPGQFLVKSRPVSGLDSSAFDKHAILFESASLPENANTTGSGNFKACFISFKQALSVYGYLEEVSFYFARIYSIKN